MRATARVVAVAGKRGETRLAVLSGQPPLLLRRTGATEVHLVGGAAGPLGGDRLRLEVEVGAGAELVMRTVAASVALPGADGAESRVDVVARVAAGGRLRWLPEPLIAAAGCRHVAASTVDVAEGGWLCWRDELVCGRHGEAPGDVRVVSAFRYAGRPLYHHDLAVGPSADGWSGPAVLGSARATGSLLVADPAWLGEHDHGNRHGGRRPRPAVLGPGAALMPLAGPAYVATAVGADLRQVRARLDPVLPPVRSVQPELSGVA
jgi:urease accessory protein